MDNLHIVNLSSYTRPQISEAKGRKWVNYGDDNNYYQYLIDLYTDSTTNNAIINGVSNMIYGKGLDALDSSTKTEEYAALRSIFSNECLRKIALDIKLLGEASFQVIYKKGQVYKAEHFPRQTLRAEKCNDDGDIEAYYYHNDWGKSKPSDKPQRIAAFGFGNGNEPEIKIIKRYVSGYDYYCPVDYQGGLAYAELESEVADYLINDVQNGFSGTKVVNFNNGVPDREKQLKIKNDVMAKLTGARGEKVIIAFNNNVESKTTVEDVSLTDAPSHYEYLSTECARKLMVAHRVTSPLLLGIRDGNNGLGNNADEIRTASLLFNNITIKPYQDLITDAIAEILAVNGISLKLYFKTLQPLEFIETENAITDEAREEETGVKLSKEEPTDQEMLKQLEGLGESEEELLEQGWELFDERPVDYDQEEALDKMLSLASVAKGKPDAESEQDIALFKVRYRYAPLTVSAKSRDFCRKMVTEAKLYRKEDLDKESTANSELAASGETSYNLWLWKGGANCHHYWERKTFIRKRDNKGQFLPNEGLDNDKNISVNEARRRGFTPPVNDPNVAKRPIDMPNKGYKNID